MKIMLGVSVNVGDYVVYSTEVNPQKHRLSSSRVKSKHINCVYKQIMEGKRSLSQASVNIHSGAGRETYIQYIDEKIQSLKKENESSAMNYEQKEEFLANDLS